MEIDFQELIDNPNKFGLPTFEDFKKNPDKYRKTPDKHFSMLDSGTTIFKNSLTKMIYYFENIRCESLNHAIKIARDLGYDLSKCPFEPKQTEDRISGKVFYIVTFRKPVNIIL